MSEDVDIRIRLRGGRVAAAEARSVAAGVESIGGAASRTRGRLAGLKATVAGIGGQLRGIGEASGVAARQLGFFGVMAAGFGAKLGFDYNRTLDSQRVAFTTFMRSGERAAEFMRELRALAMESPVLDPKSTGEAARMLMAYGVAIEDVIPLVKAIGDMSAASGKSISEVMPMAAMAIGQVASKGKLQAEELNQLAESVGLSRTRIREALGMTRDEFERSFTPGNSIRAEQALPAIRKAMEEQARGAAKMLAKTPAGQFDRLREVLAMKLGEGTRGLWQGLGRGAGGLADALQAVDAGGIARDIAGGLRKALRVGREAFADFIDAIRPAKPLWDNVLQPLLKGLVLGVGGALYGAFKLIVPVAKLFFRALGWIGNAAEPLRPVFQGLGVVLGFLFGGPILTGIGVVGKLGGVFRVLGAVATALSWPIRGLGVAFGFVFRHASRVASFIGGRLFSLLGRLPGILTGAARGFANFASRAWSAVKGGIDRVLGFLGGLGRRFMEAGRRMWRWIVDGLKAAFGSGLAFVGDLAKAFANAVIGFLNDAIPNKIPVPGAPDIPLPDNPIPALAAGGVTTTAGAVLVGEAGPELLSLPRGARVDPLPRRGPMQSTVGRVFRERPIITKVYLDRRQIAEAVGAEVDDRQNRR